MSKRLHVSVVVDDIDTSAAFYAALFGAQPTVRKPDYAKWMLDDPRVNFSIIAHGETTGVNHLGIQVENDGELNQVYDRMKQAQGPVFDTGKAVCGYARSEKSWIKDPQGVAWEVFLTSGSADVYSETPATRQADTACCAGATPSD